LSIIATAAQRVILAGRSYTTVTGKGFRPRQVELGRWGMLTFTLAALYVVLPIAAPLAVLTAAALSTYTWSGQYTSPTCGARSALTTWILLFSLFMTELSMVILLYSESTRTFSIFSFEVWNVGDFSRLAALSLLQTSIGLALAVTPKAVFGGNTM
jgi:ABC-type Fe3+ transport system permease subunit